MNLKLLTYTLNPVTTIMNAVRTCHQNQCYSDSTGMELGPNDKKLLEKVIMLGHESVLEHVSFTFQFKISRAAQTQLIRHRISAYSIESQRHVECTEYFIPEKIFNNEHALKLFYEAMEFDAKIYKALQEFVPIEDARYVLPNAMLGEIVYTANLRSLRNAIAERTCIKAQKEIRDLFIKIKAMIYDICPTFIFRTEKYYRCKNDCSGCL